MCSDGKKWSNLFELLFYFVLRGCEMILPQAFADRMKIMLGDEWESFLSCYLNDSWQGLRFNRLKVPSDEERSRLWSLLATDVDKPCPQMQPVPWTTDGYYYSDKCMRPGRHPFHEIGLYYIQEPSAMSAAALLAPRPGMRVLDLCAAPGGKTTQLASFLRQKGLLVANEINSARARILSQNVERMGIRNCVVTNEDSTRLADHFDCFFHAILVDAPCSGEGMFRKNEAACEEWSLDNVRLCQSRQAQILDEASRMLLPGGRMVYSTCTFSPEENEISIRDFLRRHPDFHIESADAPWFSSAVPAWAGEKDNSPLKDTFRLWPQKLRGEGHFAAVLRKEGSLPAYETPEVSHTLFSGQNLTMTPKEKKKGKQGKKGHPAKAGMTPDGRALVSEFLSSTLSASALAEMNRGSLQAFGDWYYLLPEGCPSLAGLHVLRAGLQLGECTRGRFEPSHSLALALGSSDARQVCNLQLLDPRTCSYLNGETFSVDEKDFADPVPNGWCLVTIEGYSAGWGKIVNQTMKNHYPKGLRKDLRPREN